MNMHRAATSEMSFLIAVHRLHRQGKAAPGDASRR
jgi:hypothetical protein